MRRGNKTQVIDAFVKMFTNDADNLIKAKVIIYAAPVVFAYLKILTIDALQIAM
jgi:hypothetical protein